jgi:hypothetical protein
MTNKSASATLIDQILNLPEEAQTELVQILIEMRAEQLGLYQLDEDDRVALERSAEDVRLGRFATDSQIDDMFARYGA